MYEYRNESVYAIERQSSIVHRCRRLIFHVQEDEALDNTLDTHLLKACRSELEIFCASAPPERKLRCLRVT